MDLHSDLEAEVSACVDDDERAYQELVCCYVPRLNLDCDTVRRSLRVCNEKVI